MDGCSVGAIEYVEFVGRSVGNSLGLPEISELGAIDGSSDGLEDGTMDGTFEGGELGAFMGANDGETENEGDGVGRRVGDKVGATQVSWKGRHLTRRLPAGAIIPLH